jgi:hypothetical protein
LSANISLSPDFLDDVVRFVEISSLTTKRALDEVAVHQQCQQKAASMRPELLKHMLAAGVVTQKRAADADAMLAEHYATMTLLKAAVDKIKELQTQLNKQASDSGEAVDPTSLGLTGGGGSQKIAGDYDSLTHPIVGLRTSNVKESDRPLLALIGK